MALPNLDNLFSALARSPFRARFRLRNPELAYLRQKGLPTVMQHARDFVAQRLAPAHPHHDGKQTPMRGHPVFLAQHATATCCRACLAKWHHIPQGQPLDELSMAHVLAVIERWLTAQNALNPVENRDNPPIPPSPPSTDQPTLF